jgi:hypothetical protein
MAHTSVALLIVAVAVVVVVATRWRHAGHCARSCSRHKEQNTAASSDMEQRSRAMAATV